MKSRTSFFNGRVLKKDILRFSPLWGIYTVIILLYLLGDAAWSDRPADLGLSVLYLLGQMGICNLIYAGLAAILLFGDLFKTRLCNAMHTMPLRREGWFLTHVTAGMLFCIVPNLLGAVIGSFLLGEYAYLAWVWLAVTVLQYLCFFGIGAFVAQIAGTGLGALACYLLVNFLPVIVGWLVASFYDPVLYGVDLQSAVQPLENLCPSICFGGSQYVDLVRDGSYYEYNSLIFQGFLRSEWIGLYCAGGAGLALMGAGMLLYRKRHLERAGDFLAVRLAKPVFLLLYTLCIGALLHLIGEGSVKAVQYTFTAVGLAVGFFTGWMLLEKRVKIFKLKRIGGFAVLLVAFFGSIFLTWLDPIGVTRYVPEIGNVESVTISPSRFSYYYRQGNGCTLTQQQDVEAIRQIHQQLTRERPDADPDSELVLEYTLRNGRKVSRYYELDAQSEPGKKLKKYYSNMEALFGTDDVDALLAETIYMRFEDNGAGLPNMVFTMNRWASYDMYDSNVLEFYEQKSLVDSQELKGLLEAIEKDCTEGRMAQQQQYHPNRTVVGVLWVYADNGQNSDLVAQVLIYTDCANTCAYLRSLAGK